MEADHSFTTAAYTQHVYNSPGSCRDFRTQKKVQSPQYGGDVQQPGLNSSPDSLSE